MELNLKVEGIPRVRALLRNVASRVPETARKTMHRAADRVVKRAKLYVPEDTTALRESIRKDVAYGYRGRLKIDIIVGAATYVNVKGREINLDDYALIIHEHYSALEPGPGTVAKRAGNPGVYIGERFLTRAMDDEVETLNRDMNQAVTRILRDEESRR